MSLSRSGVWQVGVWNQTCWADGVWQEAPGFPTTASTGKSDRHRKPLGLRLGRR